MTKKYVKSTSKSAHAARKFDAEQCLETARRVIDIEVAGIRQVQSQLGEPFLRCVGLCMETLERGGKLVLTGVGKSGHIGHKLAATLASTGSTAVFMHPVEAMHGDLGVLGPNDLLIALSYSGETEELLAVLPAAKRLGVPIIAICGNTDSRMTKWSDLAVPMAVEREACPFKLAPTTSTTALLALGDALAIVLLEQRKFQKTDYARLHPSGAIGRSITLKVTDLMRTGAKFPTVRPDVTVKEALVAMTRARAGSVAVTDAKGILLGIFTDGDFRRHIVENPKLMNAKIATVMTAGPISISSEAMAVDILKIIEKRRVDDILVVDPKGRAVGLIDVQDLPGFKLM